MLTNLKAMSTTLEKWLHTSKIKQKSKKKNKKHTKLTTLLKLVDTIVIFATTSSSNVFSATRMGLITIPTSSGIECGLTTSNKIIHEILLQNILYTKNQLKKIIKQMYLLII